MLNYYRYFMSILNKRLIKQIIFSFFAAVIIAPPVFATDKAVNASKVAGTYQVIVPPLNGVFYGVSSPLMSSPLKIAKNGKLSGNWGTSSDGLTVTGSTKVKGKVKKISSSKISTKATFTFTLSNGAKGKGTAQAFTGAPSAIVGSLKAGGETVKIAGVRM